MKWTESEKEFLKAHYENDLLLCINTLNRSRSAIRQAANKLGLFLSKEYIYEMLAKNKVDSSKFINIDDQNFAYILGLIWADGNVYFSKSGTPIIKHSCIINDYTDFSKIFNRTGEWGQCTFKNGGLGKKLMVATWTSNRKLGTYLINNNWHNKNAGVDIQSLVGEKYISDFVRGYFDGDGCISIGITQKKWKNFKICFASTYNQDWTFISKILDELKIEHKIRTLVSDRGKASQLYFQSNKSAKIFTDFIYKNSDGIRLERKYNKYLELIKYLKSDLYGTKRRCNL